MLSSNCYCLRIISKWFKGSSLLKFNNFRSQLILLTSLSLEDQLLFYLVDIFDQINITIDTNLLFPRTLELSKLMLNIKISDNMIILVKWGWALCAKGRYIKTNIYENHSSRLYCCFLRKVESISQNKPLGVQVSGVRIPHSFSRRSFESIQWDRKFKHIKLCALSFWYLDDIMHYLWSNSICYNSLHDIGFKSIGCSPCTRATKYNEKARAGRWWWENKQYLFAECGLHTS